MKHQDVAAVAGTVVSIEKHQHSFVKFDQVTLFQSLKELNATEFKVFMFLSLRAYAWDDKTRRSGNGVARATGSFIAKGTVLSQATSERGLVRLQKKELISKFHHSCKWGNTYSIKLILMLRTHSNDKAPPTPQVIPIEPVQPPQIEVPKNEGPQKSGPSPIKLRDKYRSQISLSLSLSLSLRNF